MSDGESEEETLNKQSNCGSPDPNQNIDLSSSVDELKRQRGRSEASFADSLTSSSCSSEEEGELGATTAEVEELERLARVNDSSELEEVFRGE